MGCCYWHSGGKSRRLMGNWSCRGRFTYHARWNDGGLSFFDSAGADSFIRHNSGRSSHLCLFALGWSDFLGGMPLRGVVSFHSRLLAASERRFRRFVSPRRPYLGYLHFASSSHCHLLSRQTEETCSQDALTRRGSRRRESILFVSCRFWPGAAALCVGLHRRYESALNVPAVVDSDGRGLAHGTQRAGSA